MNILFDQNTPVPLRSALSGHLVETAYERGWSTLGNGDLLTAAEAASFDVLITTDQNIQNQQNLAQRRIAVIALPTTRWLEIQRYSADIVAAIASIRPGECRALTW